MKTTDLIASIPPDTPDDRLKTNHRNVPPFIQANALSVLERGKWESVAPTPTHHEYWIISVVRVLLSVVRVLLVVIERLFNHLYEVNSK
ncbi:MAG: hypothetical protein V7K40_22765 [Nostoc sp.]|uniref:hypothetical protein n=1 Tax=Nostoc sp. TaxID=1180 RepID=UPI002FF53C94